MDCTADPLWWRSRIFFMLGPDCLRRGLLDETMERFRRIGLHPVGWRVADITPTHMDAMSKAQDAGAGAVYRYRAMDALFALGPTVLVVLGDAEGNRTPEALYRTANETKGNADPALAAPGTVRHDLGSVNVVMSLLHISDGPAQSAREAELLGGVGGLFRADEEPVASASTPPAGGMREFGAVLAATQAPETRLFPRVLASVRGRLVSRCWESLTPRGRSLAAECAADGTLSAPEVGRQLAEEIPEGAENSTLAEVLRTPFDAEEPPPDMARVRRIMQLNALEMDSWEYAVLTTSSYFPPVR